jgi:hypothetical protein
MKSSLLKSALLAVVGLALCAPIALHAQTDTVNPIATSPVKNPAPAKAAKVSNPSYKGTVKSIDTAANTITVTTAKGDITLAITPTTKIKSDKKKATLADITMGEKVTGSYTKDASGAMTAASIHGHTK